MSPSSVELAGEVNDEPVVKPLLWTTWAGVVPSALKLSWKADPRPPSTPKAARDLTPSRGRPDARRDVVNLPDRDIVLVTRSRAPKPRTSVPLSEPGAEERSACCRPKTARETAPRSPDAATAPPPRMASTPGSCRGPRPTPPPRSRADSSPGGATGVAPRTGWFGRWCDRHRSGYPGKARTRGRTRSARRRRSRRSRPPDPTSCPGSSRARSGASGERRAGAGAGAGCEVDDVEVGHGSRSRSSS